MSLAIIPARGGSQRIPRKNSRDFCGQPMLAYAIQTARESRLFEHVIVTTDDAEIAELARRQGAEVPFMRAPELATDRVGTIPVIINALAEVGRLGWQVDLACCIYPATPLLRATDVEAALQLLEEHAADFSFAVAEFPSAIQRALRRLPDASMQPFSASFVDVRTQDLEPAYYDAGQFYWGRADAWRAGRSPHERGVGLVIPQWRAVDIDTPADWARAELIYRALINVEHDRHG